MLIIVSPPCRWCNCCIFFKPTFYRFADEESEAARLHREVFSNEKGFLASAAFNPARAKAQEEEEEAQRLASEWGSTPDKAKAVMEKTKSDKDLSFQVRTCFRYLLSRILD